MAQSKTITAIEKATDGASLAEISISVLLVVLIVCAIGFVYLWLLWLFADTTNP